MHMLQLILWSKWQSLITSRCESTKNMNLWFISAHIIITVLYDESTFWW